MSLIKYGRTEGISPIIVRKAKSSIKCVNWLKSYILYFWQQIGSYPIFWVYLAILCESLWVWQKVPILKCPRPLLGGTLMISTSSRSDQLAIGNRMDNVLSPGLWDNWCLKGFSLCKNHNNIAFNSFVHANPEAERTPWHQSIRPYLLDNLRKFNGIPSREPPTYLIGVLQQPHMAITCLQPRQQLSKGSTGVHLVPLPVIYFPSLLFICWSLWSLLLDNNQLFNHLE